MSLHVQRQVIRAAEAPFAMVALERLGPCVFAIVTGQLVRPRKPPLASLPGALVRLLSWKKETVKIRHTKNFFAFVINRY